jgi:hypothetical protein
MPPLFADIAKIAAMQEALEGVADRGLGKAAARRAAYSERALDIPEADSAEFREADRCAVASEAARRLVVASGGNRRAHDRRL